MSKKRCYMGLKLLIVPVFPAISQKNEIQVKGWSELDFSKYDYRKKIANGEYDNGAFIRTSKNFLGKGFLVVVDFDGIGATKAWFGKELNVD